jgi:PAS domain S-box-containing protein
MPIPERASSFWSSTLIPLVAGSVALGICGMLYLWQVDEIGRNQLDREARRGEILSHLLNLEFQSVGTDVALLSDGDGLRAFLDTGKPADRDRAIHRAVFFSRQRPHYDQIRFLDERGQEIIRVNEKGEVVPADKLQNKADRPYFKKAMLLAPGEIYISAFDLNVENGRIEEPIKPTVRFATPVFDAGGRRRGVYVINYLGDVLIDRLRDFVPRYKQRFRLLDAQGYWIKAATPEQEWGFMLPNRSGMTLAQTDPGLWRQIIDHTDGQGQYRGGIFTWHRVTLREEAAAAGNLQVIQPEEPFLVVASEITPTEWNALFLGLREVFLIIGVVVLLLVAISWRIYSLRQRAQKELDRFFVLTRDMVCIADFNGHFTRVNPAWEKTLGYTEEELISRPFLDFVHPEDQERTALESAKLATGGETLFFENRYRCKDGSYRWLSWCARSLLRERTIFASARDLTERRHIDEQILKLNDDLKERAAQLEIANKELEAFSYSVSHDLRAPLRHVHGFVELLQKAPAIQADQTSIHHMGVISNAAKQMGVLIDDLLAFSRTGRAEMHLAKVNLNDLVEQTIGDLRMDYGERKVEWEVHPMPVILGDAALLRLVLVNLLSNALKFTRPREVARIEIGSVAEGEQAAAESVFYVRDNGVGFEMEYASKLFGVFQRLHRAQDFEGTGIGLANVQRIIHRHGGRVLAESRLDHGATFYFSLPHTQTRKPHDENKENPAGRR